MKNTSIGKLIAVFLSILLCFGFILSCDGTNTPVPDDSTNQNSNNSTNQNGNSSSTNQNGNNSSSTTTTTVEEEQVIPNDELAVEVEDTTYDWADWTAPAEIPYEAPVDDITIKKLQMISIGPGANCSTEMTINWHSYEPVNYVEYTMADDTAFANSRKVWLKAELTKGSFTVNGKVYGWNDGSKNDNTKFYVCKTDLTKLKPNTDYIYRVGTHADQSDTYKFKTAGKDGGVFSFFWASDLHTPKGDSSYIKNITDLINYSNVNLKKEGLPEIGFALFTGDLVNEGGIYKDWTYWDSIAALKNYMFATITGNHDYYWDKNHDGRVSNRWQLECTAYPATNTYTKSGSLKTLPPSNYWFLYNKVLFIGIDSMGEESVDPDGKTDITAQKAWFKAVVEENKGKFNYIVAHQHFAYLVNNEAHDWGPFNDWYTYYTNYGVDFALGSDSHEYSRTYEIRGSKSPVKNGRTGTVYVTSPMTEGTIGGVTYQADTTKPAEFYGGGCVAGAYFVVDSNKMTLNVVGKDGTIYDTKSVGRKTRE